MRIEILEDMWKQVEKKDSNVPWVLDESKFTGDITEKLREFEKYIIKAMR